MARKIGSDGERTREAASNVAQALFARKGYEGVSMREIADGVGMQASALYNYWPTKQDLLRDLMERHMRELLQAWTECNAPDDPLGRLQTFVRFHISHHMRRIDSTFISYMELRSLDGANFAHIGALRNRYERDLALTLGRGIASGVLGQGDPRIMARAIIALLNGIMTWYRHDGPIGPEALEEEYWSMVARMTGADQTEEVPCSTPA